MDRIVFITGASSGIGYHTAKIFLKEGYIVVNASRRKAEDERIINYTVDVSNPETIDIAVQDVINKFGKIDILINSAGFSMAAPVDTIEEKDYKYLFDVNFFGALYTIKKVIPIMKKNGGGRIVNISSIGSVAPIPFDPYYSASKAALDMLGISLNTELNSHNIFISNVLPGGTKTEFSFKRKVYEYEKGSDLQKAKDTLIEMEQKGMSAEKVAETVFRAATSKTKKIIVPVGFKNKMIYCLMKTLPKKLIVKLMRMIFLNSAVLPEQRK